MQSNALGRSPLPSQPLETLRGEIDRLDDHILALIEQRLSASAAVAALKEAQDNKRLKLRPRREAAVIGRLSSRARRAPPELISHVWRGLMSFGLRAQVPMEIVLCGAQDRAALEAQARTRFGPAATLRWATSPAQAVEAAAMLEAVAVIEVGLAVDLTSNDELLLFERISSADGSPLAVAIGRVAPEDAINTAPPPAPQASSVSAMSEAADQAAWAPAGWRSRPQAQMPVYPDAQALRRVEARLASTPPLASVPDILHLKAQLARVGAGRAFLLQGGDCAESFAEFGADKVRTTFNLLLQMGSMLRTGGGQEIVHLARIAGQFAKPRSSPTETIGKVTLPSYRGDAVNGADFTLASRTPDPKRLLDAHRQAQVTIELLRAYSAASYADLPRINRSTGFQSPVRPVSMFTSHEALLLNYEQALTRFDERTENWWATSGHMIWLGDRTRSPGGAHVEFARGVANPIGLKCGPSLDTDELLRLIDILDPDNEPGRLVLIGRFGASNISSRLPHLMRATRRAGRRAIWSIDPMHGNTQTVGGLKTRLLADILSELRSFFEIANAEGVHPGGVHLEMTGGDVTECLGGSLPLLAEDLPRRYLTHCDPRLNQAQALDIAAAVSELLAKGTQLASDAA